MTDLRYAPTVFGLDALWLGVNAVLCVAMARVALRR
jgi:hypothetical protein